MARSFQRAKPTLAPKPKIIIACEGLKTERNYFHDLKSINRLTSVEVRVLDHEGTDPRTIVRQVAEHIRQEKNEKGWDAKRDSAWAVFDGDEHRQTPGQMDNWNSAIQQARDLKIHLAVSNPSFEFWYLLHYQDYSRNLHRDEAIKLLKNYLPSYEKSNKNYNELKPHTQQAINRADALRQRAERNYVDLHENPCCWGVAALVNSLIQLATNA